jgi:hypothetical protein
MYTGPTDEDKGRVPHLPRNLNGTIVEIDHGGVSMENICGCAEGEGAAGMRWGEAASAVLRPLAFWNKDVALGILR